MYKNVDKISLANFGKNEKH